MQVCENGHVITDKAKKYPQHTRNRCAKCGAATITACKACQCDIPGHYHVAGVVRAWTAPRPEFCENCGEPFPWAGKESLDTGHEDVASLPATEYVLPLDVVRGSRGYLQQITIQANGCYEKGFAQTGWNLGR